jgi:GntR family transcriptional regulator
MSDYLLTLRHEWDLNKNDPMTRVPLYHQLYMLLKNSILDGTLINDVQMPTEQKLVETFDVSRITAKRAMDELASEKLIARHRGKGSHVTYQYEPKPVKAPLIGMLENLVEMGMHSIVKVISIETVTPPNDIALKLNFVEGQTVKKVTRVRSNEEGAPYAFYISWTLGVTDGFTKENLESTPRLNIIRENGIQLTKVEQTLGARNASMRVAQELRLKKGDALLSIIRHSFNEEDKVIDIIDCLYNPLLFNYAMVMALE